MAYSYWYDQDYSHHYDGTLGNGHLLFEVDSLREGFHTLYMTLGSGTTMRLESFMFYLPPNDLQGDSLTTEFSYWFDQDYAHHYGHREGAIEHLVQTLHKKARAILMVQVSQQPL